MSLDVTSIVDQKTATGYDQIRREEVVTSSTASKNNYNLQEDRSDRNLITESLSTKSSNQKLHIAFNLSFSLLFTSEYPVDPNSNC